jgi:hypothetical protein
MHADALMSDRFSFLRSQWSKAQAGWSGLNHSGRLYFGGWVVVLVGLALIITLKANTLTDVVFMTGMACCAMGIVVDLYTWGAQRLNRPLMKLVYSVLGIMATAMAAGGSAWTISEATGQDPSHFKTTIAFLTPLSFVPLFGLAVTLVGLIALPVLFLLAMGSLAIQDKSVTTWKLFAQMLGYLFILLLGVEAISSRSPYDALVHPLAAHAAFSLDMHSDPSCAPLQGDRVIRLNDTLIIVARLTEQGPRFLRKPCPLTAEAGELPPPLVPRAAKKP